MFYEISINPNKNLSTLNIVSALFSMLSLSWAIKDSYIYILAKNNDLSSVEIETILF